MKIIKSFSAIIVCVCITTVLHAQETKPKAATKSEVKVQPQAASNNTPSPKPDEMEKMEMNVLTPITIETPGGEQGRKIMEGKAEGTKSAGPTTPNTSNPGMQPTSTKPAGLKTQQ